MAKPWLLPFGRSRRQPLLDLLLEPAGRGRHLAADRSFHASLEQLPGTIDRPLDPHLIGHGDAGEFLGLLPLKAALEFVGPPVDPFAEVVLQPLRRLGRLIAQPLLGCGQAAVDLLPQGLGLRGQSVLHLCELGRLLLGQLLSRLVQLLLQPRGLVGNLQAEHARQVVSHGGHPHGEFVTDAVGDRRLQFFLASLAKPREEPGLSL